MTGNCARRRAARSTRPAPRSQRNADAPAVATQCLPQRASHRPATGLQHVGVDLGGAQIGVAELLLHRADVRPPLQQQWGADGGVGARCDEGKCATWAGISEGAVSGACMAIRQDRRATRKLSG